MYHEIGVLHEQTDKKLRTLPSRKNTDADGKNMLEAQREVLRLTKKFSQHN